MNEEKMQEMDLDENGMPSVPTDQTQQTDVGESAPVVQPVAPDLQPQASSDMATASITGITGIAAGSNLSVPATPGVVGGVTAGNVASPDEPTNTTNVDMTLRQ